MYATSNDVTRVALWNETTCLLRCRDTVSIGGSVRGEGGADLGGTDSASVVCSVSVECRCDTGGCVCQLSIEDSSQQ